MADKKISQLTQLTSANAITDVLPIVDSSLNQTNKITAAKFPMSASAIARSYPYTRDFISGTERTRNLTSITTSSGYYYSSVTSIYIGSAVTSIANNAFYGSSLTSITIGSSVTSIGSYAFQYCTSLSSIAIPDSVTSIGSYAFNYCTSLTSVTIGNGVTTIENSAFVNCTSLTSVTIGNSVTSIGNYTFQTCSNLATINSLATTAPTLGGGTSVFNGVAATTITVPAGSTQSYKDKGNGTTYGNLTIVEA